MADQRSKAADMCRSAGYAMGGVARPARGGAMKSSSGMHVPRTAGPRSAIGKVAPLGNAPKFPPQMPSIGAAGGGMDSAAPPGPPNLAPAMKRGGRAYARGGLVGPKPGNDSDGDSDSNGPKVPKGRADD